jgi:hypothetical protein
VVVEYTPVRNRILPKAECYTSDDNDNIEDCLHADIDTEEVKYMEVPVA